MTTLLIILLLIALCGNNNQTQNRTYGGSSDYRSPQRVPVRVSEVNEAARQRVAARIVSERTERGGLSEAEFKERFGISYLDYKKSQRVPSDPREWLKHS